MASTTKCPQELLKQHAARNNIQKAGVQYILNSVMPALQKDARRRFTYVEMAFFYRWWREQPDSVRAAVRSLVNDGVHCQ